MIQMMVGLNSGDEARGPLRAIDERVRRRKEARCWTGGEATLQTNSAAQWTYRKRTTTVP